MTDAHATLTKAITRSAIDVPSMADLDDEHHKPLILDGIDKRTFGCTLDR